MKRSLIAWALLLPACGGTDDPLDSQVGASTLSRRVGPGGATLRGDGAGPLEGFELVIPAGALDRLADVSIAVGPAITEPGTAAASAALRVQLRPDPGVLLVPATLSMAVDLPTFRTPDDLVVVGRWPAAQPSALASSGERTMVLAERGTFDRASGRYTCSIAMLGDLQVRLADQSRLAEDAARLVVDGYARLADLTSTAVVEADVLFAEAQAADPWSATANLLRAVSRILVVIDDRRDSGPGLDSVGEVLAAFGIDVQRESLLARLQSGRWPQPLVVPAGAPTIAAVQGFSRTRVRPALAAALRDLDRVPADTHVLLGLPAALSSDPGEREFDTADLLAMRTLVAGGMFALDWLEDLDLEVDLAQLTSPAGRATTYGGFFAAYPAFGRLRSLPEERTVAALQETLHGALEAFDALAAEDDPQADDLLVFDAATDAERRALWRSGLLALRESAHGAGLRTVMLGGGRGSLDVDLSSPYASGAFEPRFAIPEFLGFLPLAGTVERPDLGGLLPGMTQDRLTELLDLYDVHDLGAASIAVDGEVVDWPASAAALAPLDPRGDTSSGVLRAVDLEQLWIASAGDELAFRLSVRDHAIGFRADQPTVYGLEVRDREARQFGATMEIAVHVDATGPRIVVSRDGQLREVRAAAAWRGGELEIAVDRFDLLDPDEPITDRVVWGFAEALDPVAGTVDRDRTRGVAVRF